MALRFLLAVLSTAALLSLTAYVGLAYSGRSKTLYIATLEIGPSRRQQIFLLLAAGGLLTCLFQGAKAMLFWLPSSWGHLDEYGEYETFATTVALLFASGGLFLISFITQATQDKVLVPVFREKAQGLSEILRVSLSDSALADLERRHTEQAAELSRVIGPLPQAYNDDDIRRYMGPSRERIAVLENLATAAKEQRRRLEQAGVR